MGSNSLKNLSSQQCVWGEGGEKVNWYSSSCTQILPIITVYIYRMTFPHSFVCESEIQLAYYVVCFFTVSVICCAPHLKSHATTAFYAFAHLFSIFTHNFDYFIPQLWNALINCQ